MNVLDHFSIPYKGLKIGVHHFKFDVDKSFFEAFDTSYINNGQLSATLSLDKRSDMAIADIDLKGTIVATCDRCLEEFDLPVNGEFTLHIKFAKIEEEQDEVIFIDPDSSHINFAKFVYDSICLSKPLVNYHENEQDCDQDMIKKLNENRPESKVEGFWNILNEINIKGN